MRKSMIIKVTAVSLEQPLPSYALASSPSICVWGKIVYNVYGRAGEVPEWTIGAAC